MVLQAAKTFFHVPSLDPWDEMKLEYKLRWPLHILLTPEVNQYSMHLSRRS